MVITRLVLNNWRNFRHADVRLGKRVFIVGPNASGKSNFLDVFRFLREIAIPGGGLQKAAGDRGGMSKIRCLAARRKPEVEIELHFSSPDEREPSQWRYVLALLQEPRGTHRLLVSKEEVWRGEKRILTRPNSEDRSDSLRLTQTYLEQVTVNQDFRKVYDHLKSVNYLHLVPQMVRRPDMFSASDSSEDPFGRTFLHHLAGEKKNVRESRLRRINEALKSAVPQLRDLKLATDKRGIPHLEALYEHWRGTGARQREDQFSDGTIRLIGLLYALLESDTMLLLEEPELSLHSAIVRKIPSLIYKLQAKRGGQVLLSTHNPDLLMDPGIGGEEVLLLEPTSEGTEVRESSSIDEVRQLLEAGFTVAEAVMNRTAPRDVEQLSFVF